MSQFFKKNLKDLEIMFKVDYLTDNISLGSELMTLKEL